jgi:hypothetical protein
MNHRSERINLIDGDEQERTESEEVLATKGQSNNKISGIYSNRANSSEYWPIGYEMF